MKKKTPSQSPQTHEARLQDYFTTVTILESLSDLIFILNTEGVIEYANQSALTALNEPLEAVRGKVIDEFLVDYEEGEDPLFPGEGSARNLIDKIREGIHNEIEAAFVSQGRLVPVLVNFNVIHDQGKPAFIIVSAKDISHRKQIEFAEKEKQMEVISRDRIRAVGELSVGLVHEITQPLAALILKLELAKKKIADPTVRPDDLESALDQMSDLAQKISEIIQNIRRFAQQTEEEMLGIVDLKKTIDTAIQLVSHEFMRHSIDIKVRAPKQLSYVIANPLTIEQVFVNLLTNARDAFDRLDAQSDIPCPEKKYIHISLHEVKGKWVEIRVSDNAGGINKKILDRIFDPFFTTKSYGMNTGMGLSISKKIIQAIGGDIHVKVKENVGTQFTVRIPLTQKDDSTFLKNLIEMHHRAT